MNKQHTESFFSENLLQLGLWVLDLQENLVPPTEEFARVLKRVCFAIEMATVFSLPILVTEQYPKGLGKTVEPVKKLLPKTHLLHEKTTFSGYKDPKIRKVVEDLSVNWWILVGMEAHICVLQTAKDLLNSQKQVIVLRDAIRSRTSMDGQSALNEMQQLGVRVTTVETLAYELVGDAAQPEFKQILSLVKRYV